MNKREQRAVVGIGILPITVEMTDEMRALALALLDWIVDQSTYGQIGNTIARNRIRSAIISTLTPVDLKRNEIYVVRNKDNFMEGHVSWVRVLVSWAWNYAYMVDSRTRSFAGRIYRTSYQLSKSGALYSFSPPRLILGKGQSVRFCACSVTHAHAPLFKDRLKLTEDAEDTVSVWALMGGFQKHGKLKAGNPMTRNYEPTPGRDVFPRYYGTLDVGLDFRTKKKPSETDTSRWNLRTGDAAAVQMYGLAVGLVRKMKDNADENGMLAATAMAVVAVVRHKGENGDEYGAFLSSRSRTSSLTQAHASINLFGTDHVGVLRSDLSVDCRLWRDALLD